MGRRMSAYIRFSNFSATQLLSLVFHGFPAALSWVMPNLKTLPPEIIRMILKSALDLETLFSVIQTCPSIYHAFQPDSHCIMRSIFWKECASTRHYNWGKVFRELTLIVRNCDKRGYSCIFEDGWLMFTERHLEELPIPIGMILAW